MWHSGPLKTRRHLWKWSARIHFIHAQHMEWEWRRALRCRSGWRYHVPLWKLVPNGILLNRHEFKPNIAIFLQPRSRLTGETFWDCEDHLDKNNSLSEVVFTLVWLVTPFPPHRHVYFLHIPPSIPSTPSKLQCQTSTLSRADCLLWIKISCNLRRHLANTHSLTVSPNEWKSSWSTIVTSAPDSRQFLQVHSF